MIYKLLRPFLFSLPPETAHELIFKFLEKIDLRNITNIIFNKIESYPECEYLFDKNCNITFVKCHKNFEEFINSKR